jgi:peptide/nickel transport system permease protein
MTGFILNRLLQAAVNILFISLIVFLLARSSGDPANYLIPDGLPPEAATALRTRLGLDRPIYEQYYRFISSAVRGDFGISLLGHRPVLSLIAERIPATFSLALVAMAIALAMGVPLGVLSAVHRGKAIDRFGKVIAFVGQSTPPFWLAIMLILFFGVFLFEQGLPALPVSGRGGPETYILPAFAMGFAVVAGVVRLTRSSMLDVLDRDYMTMARAKGLPRRTVTWKHALRNALIPLVTYAGLILAGFLSGSIVAEQIFSWPGLGRLLIISVTQRDFPVVQGVVIILGTILILVNVLVDILYAFIDPRIRLSGTS